MRQSAKQFKDPSKSETRSAQLRVDNKNAAKLYRAIAHVEAMLKAMYARQGKKALASGRAAVAEL
jgi:hypothetical protein